MRVVLIVYDGVLDSECEAFRSVLGLVGGVEFVTAGARCGDFAGPGGAQHADQRFDEIDDADVVIVPGGLGCERAADDPQLREFLHRMERSSRFIAASSTGSVVVAAAGLLHGASAATHWLATDLLRKYGSEADVRRLVVTGNVITCEGRISAVEAAFTLVERLEGRAGVDRIRATLIERGQPLLRRPGLLDRLLATVRDWLGVTELAGREEPTGRFAHDSTEPPVTPLSVMVELVENDDERRQLKRSANRRRRR